MHYFDKIIIYSSLIFILLGCGNGGQNGTATNPVIIGVTNNAAATNTWNPSKLSNEIEVWNAQLKDDVAPHWGVHTQVALTGNGDYSLTFEAGNGNDCGGAPSCHDVSNSGQPFAIVFIGNPTVTSTSQAFLDAEHENIEMSTDPSADSNQKEAVDPVYCLTYEQGIQHPSGSLECGEGYGSDNNPDRCVPDFVFPNYFKPGSQGPWDFMGIVTAAGVSPCH